MCVGVPVPRAMSATALGLGVSRNLSSRNRPFSRLIPGWMAQSAVVRDYRALEIGLRRAKRLGLTVAG
jgi:hypothetical protein